MDKNIKDILLKEWEERTFAFLAAKGFAPHDATLILAVSGGADSMGLLEFWARAGAPRFGCRLNAVHIHHGLRASADGDQALVEERCRALGIPLQIFRLDPGSRRTGESMEMWARRERYRCFRTAAAEAAVKMSTGAAEAAVKMSTAAAEAAVKMSSGAAEAAGKAFILTAHHRDDLVETVFQRLGRGTGARGLGGIPFRRAPDIIRPFLDRSRDEIRAYLGLLGAPWREDETNGDLRIGRNWYRHRYLPPLRASEPDLDARIFSMAMAVQDIGDGLIRLEEAEGLLRRDEDGKAFLPEAAVEERLAERDSQSLRHWLRRLAEASVSAAPPVTEEILRELHRQWRLGTRTLRVPVGPQAYLERRKHGFYWEIGAGGASVKSLGAAGRAKKECLRPDQRIILDNGQATANWRWDGREYTLSVRTYPRPLGLRFPADGEGRAIFDAARFSCTLLVRTRKDGDRFSPLGVRSESRKLKVFLNEKKIPAGHRDSLPLVFAEPHEKAAETLAWVPGHGISDFYKVGDRTSTILEMELTCRNP